MFYLTKAGRVMIELMTLAAGIVGIGVVLAALTWLWDSEKGEHHG